MYGYKLQRAPDGQVIYDPSPACLPDLQIDIEYVGNAFPEWRKPELQNNLKLKTSV